MTRGEVPNESTSTERPSLRRLAFAPFESNPQVNGYSFSQQTLDTSDYPDDPKIVSNLWTYALFESAKRPTCVIEKLSGDTYDITVTIPVLHVIRTYERVSTDDSSINSPGDVNLRHPCEIEILETLTDGTPRPVVRKSVGIREIPFAVADDPTVADSDVLNADEKLSSLGYDVDFSNNFRSKSEVFEIQFSVTSSQFNLDERGFDIVVHRLGYSGDRVSRERIGWFGTSNSDSFIPLSPCSPSDLDFQTEFPGFRLEETISSPTPADYVGQYLGSNFRIIDGNSSSGGQVPPSAMYEILDTQDIEYQSTGEPIIRSQSSNSWRVFLPGVGKIHKPHMAKSTTSSSSRFFFTTSPFCIVLLIDGIQSLLSVWEMGDTVFLGTSSVYALSSLSSYRSGMTRRTANLGSSLFNFPLVGGINVREEVKCYEESEMEIYIPKPALPLFSEGRLGIYEAYLVSNSPAYAFSTPSAEYTRSNGSLIYRYITASPETVRGVCEESKSPDPEARQKAYGELQAVFEAATGKTIEQYDPNAYNRALRRGTSEKVTFDYKGQEMSFFISRRLIEEATVPEEDNTTGFSSSIEVNSLPKKQVSGKALYIPGQVVPYTEPEEDAFTFGQVSLEAVDFDAGNYAQVRWDAGTSDVDDSLDSRAIFAKGAPSGSYDDQSGQVTIDFSYDHYVQGIEVFLQGSTYSSNVRSPGTARIEYGGTTVWGGEMMGMDHVPFISEDAPSAEDFRNSISSALVSNGYDATGSGSGTDTGAEKVYEHTATFASPVQDFDPSILTLVIEGNLSGEPSGEVAVVCSFGFGTPEDPYASRIFRRY